MSEKLYNLNLNLYALRTEYTSRTQIKVKKSELPSVIIKLCRSEKSTQMKYST